MAWQQDNLYPTNTEINTYTTSKALHVGMTLENWNSAAIR